MSSTTKNQLVLIGTYTEHEGSQSKGIYVYELDVSSGELKQERYVAGVLNPSYLDIHPGQRFLYAINEVDTFAGDEAGGVTAFSMDGESGEIELLNAQPSGGKGPCYISLDRTGRFALVANYGGGSAAMLPIHADGRLGPATDVVRHSGSSIHPERQTAPLVHCIRPDPTNRFAIAANLGTDRLALYAMDFEQGKLGLRGEVKVEPGSGPRHLIFHPNGKFMYLLNELSSTLLVYRYDLSAARLEELQALSTLPPGFEGENLCADLHIHGDFLYASNRKHDSIAWFHIDAASGQLTYQAEIPSGGKEPRGFAIDPSGGFLLAAHEKSDNVVVFQIDPPTGKLLKTGYEAKVSRPVCVKFVAR